jgi:hypothetical protein
VAKGLNVDMKENMDSYTALDQALSSLFQVENTFNGWSHYFLEQCGLPNYSIIERMSDSTLFDSRYWNDVDGITTHYSATDYV